MIFLIWLFSVFSYGLSFSFLLLILTKDLSLVAWVDSESAWPVSYCLTHPLRGIGDNRRTETAHRVARYQTDYYCSRENMAMLLLPQTVAALEGTLHFGFAYYFPWFLLFPLVLSLTLFLGTIVVLFL